MKSPSQLRFFAVFFLLALGAAHPLAAQIVCAGCLGIPNTFAEEITCSEVALVAKVVKTLPVNQQTGTAPVRAEIVQIFRGEQQVKTGAQIVFEPYTMPPAGTHYLLSKRTKDEPDWTWKTQLSPRAHEYLLQLAKLPAERDARLKFYWQHLQDKDDLIERDAYDQFAALAHEDLKAIKLLLDHDRIVAWIQEPELPTSRRRLFLFMLCVCGSERDVPMLETMVKAAEGKRRGVGFDAVLTCYLTHKGDAGLPAIEELLKNPQTDYADVYHGVVALRFHHVQEHSLSKARLTAAFRLVLKRPEIADLVIPDLIALQDWSVAEELVALYKADEKNQWTRVPILHYLQACPLDAAKTMLKECEELDPKAAERAKKFPLQLPKATSLGGAKFRC